ncbi:hypothetical protein [Actinoallomurus rhizosphaericola]|uniref:hypothetical protein n=1 Tax=Actinoallomurus rhizosphaericola TaxID=2952536 RepID=UPI002093DA4E|nr:hypothetical protein [Actinoallomurus rhizosphaericola]MCO5999733.1 hypothetical protein [Actinoallomurus rhizosphaericola]
MIKSFDRRIVTAATAVALGIVLTPASARAAGFSMVYTCAVPLLGDRTVEFDGTLTATPRRPTAGTFTRVDLHVSRLSLRPPVAVTSWSADAEVDVSGAQIAGFRLSGSGGPVSAYDTVTGDLTGGWVPKAIGLDRLRLGKVVLRVSTSTFGEVVVPCAPRRPRPVAETIAVFTR